MKQSDVQPVIAIMGPTASGKTSLAMALAQVYPITIISVDSALVYRGMNIGTAKPTLAMQAQVPHRLIDTHEPTQAYSAAEFARDALTEIERAHAEQRVPLLVGGTMLYFRALFEGLSDLPPANVALRAELDEQIRLKGSPVLHQQLALVDPRAAQRIHPNDPQRIQRALEVYLLTGTPWSELCQARTPLLTHPVLSFIVAPHDRAVLHQRIEQRFDTMIEQGMMEEVRNLRARGDLHVGLPSMRAVGYRQVWQHLEGTVDFALMRDQAVAATRQLAKRQFTWLRHNTSATWLESESNNLLQMLLKKLSLVLT